jgi:membrane-bound inhibitor of C-type lysozyme
MLGLLAACSFEVQPEPQGEWNEWVCASEVKVYWRADGSDGQKIQLRVGAGNMLHILTRNPDDSAVRYSDNQLVFERQGNQALVYSVYGHDIIGRNCKAQAE